MASSGPSVKSSNRWSFTGKPSQMRATVSSEPSGRAQAVFVRREYEGGAMSGGQRLKTRLKKFFVRGSGMEAAERDEELASTSVGARPLQYRLEATRRSRQQSIIKWLITCCGLCGSGSSQAALGVGVSSNQRMAMYLHWMFRVNFVFLFVLMCIFFFALVILFSGFITMAGKMDPQCIRVGGEDFGHAGTAFADAFALSWTTFATVGYGSVYPALAHESDSRTNCFFINFICSLESLVGVLYAGFCGAILFGKVLRIQSHAQVVFSDPLVIRYGMGVSEMALQDGMKRGEGAKDSHITPCPVLEFRIVNRLFNEVGGEIMDATLNVVANIDANDAEPALKEGLDITNGRARPDSFNTDTVSDTGSNTESARSYDSGLMPSLHRFLGPLTSFAGRDHQTVDEDPSARLVSKHIFSKMLIEASDHPFFKRVWLARHVLDENSPIVKPRVRRQIGKNNGSWPERLNSWSGVRDSLQFNQILVSLNGVSNVSASNVYAQKIYDFVDINIGYQFVNILYRDQDGSLGVDLDLLNDVREQTGGGGEPLVVDK